MAISPILTQVSPGVAGVSNVASASGGDSDFERRLQAAVSSVSEQQNVADVRLSRLASGEEADIHTTMIAMQEADISLRLMVATRDKVVEAYQTVMNIAV